ncbi:MAG: NADH-quinone oxidoreductase subunit L [Paludibacteraceae bacterium]|nr:NADH-quinone oxidoreductase subunit L [Paludibacteraceae bacterium]
MEQLANLAPYVLILPLCMFLILGLFGKKMCPKVSGLLGTTVFGVVSVICYYIALKYFFSGEYQIGETYQQVTLFNMEWLRMNEDLVISIGFLLDPLSAIMLIVISTVSLMVHIYSMGYMHGEGGFQRFYAILSLFSFAMLGLVVATNIFQMYIFWELVGVSSFLLISFYYFKHSAVRAAKKAFIVTRFADMFFLIGILILSYYTRTFDFDKLTFINEGHVDAVFNSDLRTMTFLGFPVISIAMFLIFLGGAGKSAMFPLHIWLPDAMEGPTPASALIHAATMVVAGVYLVARLFPIYSFETPHVLQMISYIGAFTSIFAAIIACAQTDIKRVLAFSTISQIAYMMVALGVSGYGGVNGLGYTASMWHLFTHAMFKALLFMAAGAIIHAVHSNEMDAMGNLRKKLPITHITFLIACLAIAGIPPFSGFFSKDEILVAAFETNKWVFAVEYFVAGLTAFYMFRLYYRIFWFGEPEEGYEHEPHEAPLNMTFPLMFLAAVTVITGISWAFGKVSFTELISSDFTSYEIHTHWNIALPSIGAGVIGILIATFLYLEKTGRPNKAVSYIKKPYLWAYNKFYIDEIYLFVTNNIIFQRICQPIAWFDRHIIDGFMNLLSWVTNKASQETKEVQSGYVQQYAWVFIMGVITITLLSIYL